MFDFFPKYLILKRLIPTHRLLLEESHSLFNKLKMFLSDTMNQRSTSSPLLQRYRTEETSPEGLETDELKL